MSAHQAAMKGSLDQFLDYCCDFAVEQMRTEKELIGTIYGHSRKGIVAYPLRWPDGQKDLWIDAVRAHMRGMQVKRLVYLGEAWMVDLGSKPMTDLVPRPSQHPDRIEVLMVMVAERGAYLSRTYKILRPQDEPPALELYQHKHGGDLTTQSWMLELLD